MNPLTLLKSPRVFGPVLVLALFAGCDRSQSTAPGTAAPAATAPTTTAESDMYVDEPPPLPQSEVMVASPGPDYVWVGGYWGWHAGNTHAWVPGRWERPPHAHATWVQPRWERRGHGYVFIRGTWH